MPGFSSLINCTYSGSASKLTPPIPPGEHRGEAFGFVWIAGVRPGSRRDFVLLITRMAKPIRD
jgi:hypothetical protein